METISSYFSLDWIDTYFSSLSEEELSRARKSVEGLEKLNQKFRIDNDDLRGRIKKIDHTTFHRVFDGRSVFRDSNSFLDLVRYTDSARNLAAMIYSERIDSKKLVCVSPLKKRALAAQKVYLALRREESALWEEAHAKAKHEYERSIKNT
ncbi:MAG: hypothetical protein H7A38_04555 [Chlamydiales bacterium]|nr:hypothetical protein [Chlamydiales bacterium]